MPIQMTAAPVQNPSSTPAPVDTMLEGTGRNTSRARSAPMAAAVAEVDAFPCASHVDSCSNCFSKIRNGTSTTAIRIVHRTAHRTVELEIELVNIRLGEHRRRAEDDFRTPDLNLAEAPGVNRRGAWRNAVLREQRTRQHSEIPEVPRVPQHHRLHPSVVDVRLVDVR